MPFDGESQDNESNSTDVSSYWKLDRKLPDNIDRRKFIAGSAAIMFPTIAGCAGGGDGGDGGSDGGNDGGDGGVEPVDSSPSDGDSGGDTPTEVGGDGGTDTPTDGGDMGEIVKNVVWRNGWKNEIDYATPFVAIRENFWAERNISSPSVREGFGSGDTSQRVGSAKETFGYAGMSAVVGAMNTFGEDITIYGAGRTVNQLVFLWRKDRAERPQDLENQTLAGGTFGRQVLPVYMEVADIPDSNNLKFVREESSPGLLQQGELAGVMTFMGDVGSIDAEVDAPLGIDPLYNHLPVIGYPLIVNTDWLRKSEENQVYTRRVLEGYSEAGKWIMSNPEKTIDIMVQVNPALETQDRSSMIEDIKAGIAAVNLSQGTKEQGFGYVSRESVDASINRIGGVLEDVDEANLPAIDDVYAGDILEEADLAGFSDSEWQEVLEFSKPYSDWLDI